MDHIIFLRSRSVNAAAIEVSDLRFQIDVLGEVDVLGGGHARTRGNPLLALREDGRMAVFYADVQGFPYNEIAHIMNSPVATVASRLHRGRPKLRIALLMVASQRRLVTTPTRHTPGPMGSDEHLLLVPTRTNADGASPRWRSTYPCLT
jgi:hypothetical protein